jgi:hypothetical protein
VQGTAGKDSTQQQTQGGNQVDRSGAQHSSQHKHAWITPMRSAPAPGAVTAVSDSCHVLCCAALWSVYRMSSWVM